VPSHPGGLLVIGTDRPCVGVIETLQTAGAVVLAAPIAMLGMSYLLDGRTLGAAFIAIAVLLVVAQRYLLTPRDVSLEVASEVAENVVTEPADQESDSDGDQERS
jgi:hypothetical protein